jgi:hypothetical protein
VRPASIHDASPLADKGRIAVLPYNPTIGREDTLRGDFDLIDEAFEVVFERTPPIFGTLDRIDE